MADNSAIEWTDASWNPIRARHRVTGKVGWFCVHHSDGCRNCYAEGFNARLGNGAPFKAQHQKDVEIFLDEDMLTQPLRWKRPRQVFVCSMTDLFAEFVPDEMLDRIFAVMALAPQHTYQVLTKRPDRMRSYFAGIEDAQFPEARWALIEGAAQAIYASRTGEDPSLWLAVHGPLPNVWLGTSAENQDTADERLPALLATPAAVRFLSAEPLLGPVDLNPYLFIFTHDDERVIEAGDGDAEVPFHDPATTDPADIASPRLDWVIVGGESGPNARPMHPDWARQLRDQCAAAGVAFFFKQWGRWLPQLAIEGPARQVVTMDVLGRRDEAIWRDPALSEDNDPYWTAWLFEAVGKKAAGRLLDGVTHDAMPAH